MERIKIIHGRTRIVVLTRRFAVKVPQIRKFENFILGLLSNLQEVRYSKTDDGRLCPVKFHLPLGLLLVMPKCKLITNDEFAQISIATYWPSECEDYHPKNACNHVELNVPVEYKQDSFGYYNGKIVAIDYGV